MLCVSDRASCSGAGITLEQARILRGGIAAGREARELADRAADQSLQADALLNLSEILSLSDSLAAADAANRAAQHARRVGHTALVGFALSNEAAALLLAGYWDQAETVLHDAGEIGNLDTLEFIAVRSSHLAALRGDAETANSFPAPGLRASEDKQNRAYVDISDAFIAAATNRSADSLTHARAVLSNATTLGVSHEVLRWAWPLAARSAHELADNNTVSELLALLDAHPVGGLPPLLRAEYDLAAARLAATNNNPRASIVLAEAITGLRKAASPYHLAHGLLDFAARTTLPTTI